MPLVHLTKSKRGEIGAAMDRNLKKRPAALVFSQATYTTTQMSQLRTTQQQQQAKRRLTTFGTGGGVGAPQTTTEQRVQDRQRISPAASNTSTGNSQDDPLFDDNEEHDALLANLDWPSSLKPNHSAQRQAPQKPIISSASSSSNSPSTAHRSLPGPQKQTPLVVGNPPISADDDFEFDDFPMDDIALKEIDEQENMLLKMTQNVPRPQTSVSAPFSRQEPVNAVLRTGHPSTNLEDELRDLKAQQTKLLQEKNRLLAEMVSKDGEIATVRRGLSQIQSENAQLKFTLARSAEDSHREAAKVKAELLKEQERLKTELLFKDQELKSAVGARTLNVGLPVQPAKRRSTGSSF